MADHALRTFGTGTDIVPVRRVADLIARGGDRFLERWFTAAEIAYCSSKAVPALHFAARLAAKEAVVKALRSPGDGPVPWSSIEIGHDDAGAPTVRLAGRVLAVAVRHGVGPIHVSLSHCDDFAVAVAVADARD
ncbi:MAG: holo-ACP synthase [Acidimicrobiales bacterium]